MSAAAEQSATAMAPGQRAGFLRREWLPVLLFALLALLPFAAMLGPEKYTLSLLTRVMIFALAAISLDLILGYGALVSFGHAAFLGLGGYAVGILASHGFNDLALQVPAAILVSGLFALLTGAISLRTTGVYFIMITLAFGQMAFFLAVSLSAYGGDDGLTLGSRSRIFGQPWLENDRVFYALAFGLLLGAYLLCRSIVASRFGRVIRGAKENPMRMAAIGFSPFRYQLAAYVIAGMMAGLAGVMLANQAEFVAPAYMSWQRSGELIVMVILGGLGSLHGAIMGAAAFLLLEEILSGYTEHWKLIFGPFLVLVVLFARGGLLGLIKGARRG